MQSQLPTSEFKSHKVVRASKITALSEHEDGSATVFLEELDEGSRPKAWLASPEWMERQRGLVEPGGYLVVYVDDYVSYSPAAAFESGYAQLTTERSFESEKRIALPAAIVPLAREIHGHEVNECNEAISIAADAQNPANGNASHVYLLRWRAADGAGSVHLRFQDGPIQLVGVNGITGEALLAVLIDRLQCFQSSQWACPENADALAALELARDALHARTKKRLARGVEGTHAV